MEMTKTELAERYERLANRLEEVAAKFLTLANEFRRRAQQQLPDEPTVLEAED